MATQINLPNVNSMHTVDWDGISRVKVTKVTKSKITLVRYRNGKPLTGETNWVVVTPLQFSKMCFL